MQNLSNPLYQQPSFVVDELCVQQKKKKKKKKNVSIAIEISI